MEQQLDQKGQPVVAEIPAPVSETTMLKNYFVADNVLEDHALLIAKNRQFVKLQVATAIAPIQQKIKAVKETFPQPKIANFERVQDYLIAKKASSQALKESGLVKLLNTTKKETPTSNQQCIKAIAQINVAAVVNVDMLEEKASIRNALGVTNAQKVHYDLCV